MIKIGETAAKVYVGDMQPVNIYKGNTKVAGWHSQTVSGTGTISLDGAYNVPPDALVIDGKCVQTVGVWGTNIITNGDFSNGTTGWVSTGSVSALTITDGVAMFKASGVAGGYRQSSIVFTANHTYYIRLQLYGSSSSVQLYLSDNMNWTIALPHSNNIGWEYLSRTYTPTAVDPNPANHRLGVRDVSSSGWDNVYFDNVICIDLTAAFGAGNEPAAEQMDAYLAAYPNSWFDGSALLTTSGTPNSPSPTYPAPIASIAGDLTITAANGDLSDTVATPLGTVELCSLPDGTKDSYDAVTGVVTKRCGKAVITSVVNYDSYNNVFIIDNSTVKYGVRPICDRYATVDSYQYASNTMGTRSSDRGLWFRHDGITTVSAMNAWLSANPVTVYYKLAEPYTIQLTPDLPVVRTGIKSLTVSANITPSFTATIKAMD